MAPFDIGELRELTSYDELELDTLGDEKTALFLIMSDTDPTFNFLISMITHSSLICCVKKRMIFMVVDYQCMCAVLLMSAPISDRYLIWKS